MAQMTNVPANVTTKLYIACHGQVWEWRYKSGWVIGAYIWRQRSLDGAATVWA